MIAAVSYPTYMMFYLLFPGSHNLFEAPKLGVHFQDTYFITTIMGFFKPLWLFIRSQVGLLEMLF